MKTRPRVACLQCSRTTWSIVTSHKDCFSQFLKLIMSWDTIHLIHLTLEHLKGLQVLLSLRASWASRLFEQGWADAELPGIPIVRNMGRLQERGTSGFPLMSLNGTLSSLSSVFVPLWCVIDDDIFSKTYLSLRFIQPDTACSVAHLFSALPCDFQHLLSPFWFFWPESDLTRALFPPFLSQPKTPSKSYIRALPSLLCCVSICGFWPVRGGSGPMLYSLKLPFQLLPWRTSNMLHLQRPWPLSHDSLYG